MAFRGISDTVGHSESLAALSDTAERLYWRLLAHSDPYGRLPGSPPKTRALCFPLLGWTHDEVGFALAELEAVGRVWVYVVAGQACIQVTDFDENQPSEFIRRRGKPRIPDAPALKSRSCTDYSGRLYKLPANKHHSGTTPGDSGTTPATRKGKERKVLNPTAAGRAREGDETDADELVLVLNGLLAQLGVNGSTKTAAHQDPARAVACARAAIAVATRNPAGYFRALLESGDWPTVETLPLTNATPSDPFRAIATMIRNIPMDEHDLETEIAASGIGHDQAEELRAQLVAAKEAATT